jgi:hypothetical protein
MSGPAVAGAETGMRVGVVRRRVRRLGRHPLGAVLGALVTASAVSGCVGVPDSSTPRVVESVPREGFTDAPDLRFGAISPRPGESATSVVLDFLAAASSPEQRHRIARQFLTPQAATSWNDDAGAIVVSRQPYLDEGTDGTDVTIRVDQVGKVDAVGAYQPQVRAYRWRFELQRLSGEWRIDNPPPGVIVSAADFQEAYRRLNVYFLDPTDSHVVPDPRWFSAPDEALPNLLLRALLDGPSDSLRDAVRTELGTGISLTRNVVPDVDRVRVYLSGLDNLSTPMQASASAQIVWTLNQLGVPGVQLFDDAQQVRLPGVEAVQHIGDWGDYDAGDLPLTASGYFVRGGGVWTTDGRPLPGPAGSGTYNAERVGVSHDLSRIAVVGRASRNAALYVGGPQGQLARRLVASSLTTPTWGAAVDEVWTVRNGNEIVEVPLRGSPAPVTAPDLERVGRISVFHLSPDGVRVALVAGPRGAGKLYVGTVTRADTVTVDRLTAVAPDLRNVVDVAWSATDMLTVLTRSGASDATLWSVTVDGSGTDTVVTTGLPGPPSAVAAATGMPTLAVAEGGIWRLRDPHGSWSSVQRSGSQSDSAPVYPD